MTPEGQIRELLTIYLCYGHSQLLQWMDRWEKYLTRYLCNDHSRYTRRTDRRSTYHIVYVMVTAVAPDGQIREAETHQVFLHHPVHQHVFIDKAATENL